MMKSIVRLGATVGLIGSTVLGSWFGPTLSALALPEEEVLKKLEPIPVFTIADDKGSLLIGSTAENEVSVTRVFISQQDAEQFVATLQKEKPDIGNKVKVVPVSLGKVFELAQESKKEENGLKFTFVPTQQQVQSAQTILSEQGQEYKGGVPLFVARVGEDKGYVTIEQNEQSMIPFYFDQQQVEQVVDRFKKEKPDLAPQVNIQVVPLELVISELQSSEDEKLSQIVLWPSQESLQFMQSLLRNQSQNQEKK